MTKPPKRHRDLSQWAKRMVDIATGLAHEAVEPTIKDPAAVALGRKGGLKGGKARAAKFTPAQRSASGRKAAAARWKKHRNKTKT